MVGRSRHPVSTRVPSRAAARPPTVRIDHPVLAFTVALAFAAAVATAIYGAWAPPLRTYLDHVPIAAVFAALLWDRYAARTKPAPAELTIDAVAVTLAGLRAVTPPLPFLSGHALLTAYPLLTRGRWPLHFIAAIVLAHVLYDKLFVTRGGASLLAGLLMAALLAWLRHQFRERPTHAAIPR